jgi:hypothetical protein
MSLLLAQSPNLCLLRGLKGYWTLEEASGNRTDSSGNGRTLTANGTGGVVSGAGLFGNAAVFASASSKFLSLASGSATDFDPTAGDFTITAWAKPTILAATKTVFAKSNTTGNQREWELDYNSAATAWRMNVSSAGTSFSAVTDVNTFTVTGIWDFLAAGVDRGRGVVWLSVNAGPIITAAYNNDVFVGSADLTIGAANSGGAQRFDGSIDEVGYWARKLSHRELRYLYEGGRGRTYPLR